MKPRGDATGPTLMVALALGRLAVEAPLLFSGPTGTSVCCQLHGGDHRSGLGHPLVVGPLPAD